MAFDFPSLGRCSRGLYATHSLNITLYLKMNAILQARGTVPVEPVHLIENVLATQHHSPFASWIWLHRFAIQTIGVTLPKC